MKPIDKEIADKIFRLKGEELDAYLISHGFDPDKLLKEYADTLARMTEPSPADGGSE